MKASGYGEDRGKQVDNGKSEREREREGGREGGRNRGLKKTYQEC